MHRLSLADVKRHDYDTNSTRSVRARARAIGRELRRELEPILMQPVPEDMMDMLRQIDAKRGQK